MDYEKSRVWELEAIFRSEPVNITVERVDDKYVVSVVVCVCVCVYLYVCLCLSVQ